MAENEKHPLDDLKMTQITKKTRKMRKMHTEGPGIWRKKLKITENEKYTHFFRTEIWRGKNEKVENLEMSTVGREYGKKKTENHGKMRNIHLTT